MLTPQCLNTDMLLRLRPSSCLHYVAMFSFTVELTALCHQVGGPKNRIFEIVCTNNININVIIEKTLLAHRKQNDST